MNNTDEILALLADVEKSDNAYIVISPFGFKVIELDGKKYLQSITKEELREMLSNSNNETHKKILSEIDNEIFIGKCVASTGGSLCRPLRDCDGLCDPQPAGGGGWLCYCV